MKTDLYTKIVLTVIALALVCLALQNFQFITPAQASTTMTHEIIDVRIVDHSLATYEALPVTVTNN